MVFDLKAQKFVNRRERFRIAGRDAHAPTARQGFVTILNRRLQRRHRRYAGRRLRVRMLRFGKIARRERLRDVLQVLADLPSARHVFCMVGGHFNCAAVGPQPEVMRSFGLRKAHRLRAALIDFGVVVARLGFLFLMLRGQRTAFHAFGHSLVCLLCITERRQARDGQKNYGQAIFHFAFLFRLVLRVCQVASSP